MDDAWQSLATLLASAAKITNIKITNQRGHKLVRAELIYAKKGREGGFGKVFKKGTDEVLAEAPTKKLLETSKVVID